MHPTTRPEGSTMAPDASGGLFRLPDAPDLATVQFVGMAVGKALQIAAQHPPTTRKAANKTKEAFLKMAADLDQKGFPPFYSGFFRSVADGIDT